MVEGEIYVFGDIDVMMPGFAYRRDVELEVEGTKGAICPLRRVTLGSVTESGKARTVYGKLYQLVRALTPFFLTAHLP